MFKPRVQFYDYDPSDDDDSDDSDDDSGDDPYDGVFDADEDIFGDFD